ncbi:hypothetical protein [Methanosphaerula palustris]|nr:hypothetical protein [Methanosphaerula palustris]
MEQIFDDGYSLFWYEPTDLCSTTRVFYSQLASAGPIEVPLLFLCTSFDDFDLMIRNGGPLVAASTDEVGALWTELNDHAFQESRGTADAGFDVQGSILDYLADDHYWKLMLAMLGLYCDEPGWQETLGPEPAEVRSRIEGKTALVIPGDEDLVALAINLFNRGAYEMVTVEDEEEGK